MLISSPCAAFSISSIPPCMQPLGEVTSPLVRGGSCRRAGGDEVIEGGLRLRQLLLRSVPALTRAVVYRAPGVTASDTPLLFFH